MCHPEKTTQSYLILSKLAVLQTFSSPLHSSPPDLGYLALKHKCYTRQSHALDFLKTQKKREKRPYNLKVHLFKKIGKKDQKFHENNIPVPIPTKKRKNSSIINPATMTEATGFIFY